MATTYLERTISSAGSRQKATISCWIKACKIGNDERFFSYENSSVANDITVLKFQGKSNARMTLQFADQTGGSNNARWDGSINLADNAAWYHFLVSLDTTQATEANRFKVYINGVLTTNNIQGTYTYPSQNSNLNLGHNSNCSLTLGRWKSSNSQYFDGLMAQCIYTDGYAYDATTFGEVNSVSGIWTGNTSPTVTYGTNGYHVDFANSADMGNDVSGNANDFTIGGTLTQTKDCPDNNFSVSNINDNLFFGAAMTNGNTTVATPSASGEYSYGTTTLGIPDNKKIYYEVKPISITGGSYDPRIGIVSMPTTSLTLSVGNTTYAYGLQGSNGNIVTNNAGSSYGVATSLGDVIGVAVDTVNNKLYFAKNGVWMNSGDPTSGSTGTGAISIAELNPDPGAGDNVYNSGHYFPAISDEANTAGLTYSWNFGNGYFGTTAISSTGTAASTPGDFEHDVPTGYQPLTTKGLNA